MEVVTFHISPQIDLEDAWEILALEGCELLYSSQNLDGSQEIMGALPEGIETGALMALHPFVFSITPSSMHIDWESQWALHGANYHDGCVHVDVSVYGKACEKGQWPTTLKLEPGPGFGDLSHPTTRLVLQLMGSKVAGRHVLDVGCGSGILSLAAVALGASSVWGIDIDEEALIHARKNAELNGMEEAIVFTKADGCVPQKDAETYLAMMNMIQTEQVEAWKSLATFHPYIDTIITSGILVEGRAAYLKQSRQWGWKLVDEKEEEGWLAFVFRT